MFEKSLENYELERLLKASRMLLNTFSILAFFISNLSGSTNLKANRLSKLLDDIV